jgi:DNA-binding NtrC family response regulator/tetratricopeptide (TPR) repeat protein
MTFAQAKQNSAIEELEEIRQEIDRGLSSVAQRLLASFLTRNRTNVEFRALAKCLLCESLELQGKHGEALTTLREYESEIPVAKLEFDTRILIRVRLALAYNYTGDFPKAIALLNSALAELKGKKLDSAHGSVYLALSRVYRTINEYPIASDHAHKALTHFRDTGDWRGLAESYFAVALVELFEGEYEPALEHLEQVLKLVGDRPAAYLLGMTYTNLAAVCVFVRRVNEGISHFEKAISYYETTEHKTNAIAGYNNLGVHLTLSGDWKRAEESLEKALDLAETLDSRNAKLPMILDSLGELKILQGKLPAARKLLEQAVKIAEKHQNKWYAWQSQRTLGKCFIAENKPREALKSAGKVLKIGEDIGDRQAICEAHLLAAEAHIHLDDLEKCANALLVVQRESNQTQIDLGLIGELLRVQGMLAISRKDFDTAKLHFGKSISIFEILGDRYRLALAQYWLGFSFIRTDTSKAETFVCRAIEDFSAMGATLDLTRAKNALDQIKLKNVETLPDTASLIHRLTSRLTDSIISRELLLHETASVLNQETKAENILIVSTEKSNKLRVVAKHGFETPKYATFASQIEGLGDGLIEIENLARKNEFFIRKFSPLGADPAYLLIAPLASAVLPDDFSLEPLLKIVEIGLSICSEKKSRVQKEVKVEARNNSTARSTPDLVYTSSAMDDVVEEIRKIRSSDVTVLVTGESGTGKELIAHAVHQYSGRSEKPFVPFNCTAVPKELSDAYLFGYRKGAFTGAVANSEGVIRAAAGGTLFLDEIGDLPLDIQPKLLRFLQEGEIQPLGENHPVKVDVRIVAATNADLEQMVKDGSFREDLFYRLNVIRLHVPPLRMRRADIPVLISHFRRIYSEKFNRRNIIFSAQTIDLLAVCEWKGNVRQLCNEIQRLIARAEDDSTIMPENLSPELISILSARGDLPSNGDFSKCELSIPEAIDKLEREMITAALEKNNRNISRSARVLGITRRGLQLKLARYKLKNN